MSKPEAGQWPSQDVVLKLIEAAEILLHRMDYDGDGYEDISHCVELAKKHVQLQDPTPPASQPDPDDECIESFDCANGDHSDACPMASRSRKNNQPDPDEWVVLDPVKYADHVPRVGIDQFEYRSNEWVTQETYHSRITVGRYHESCEGLHRCRRRDLPPVEQPEQWPKYWTKLDPTDSIVAYVKQVSKSSGIVVYATGHEGDEFPWYSDDNHRRQLTEAEAMALLKKLEPQPAKTRVRLWVWSSNSGRMTVVATGPKAKQPQGDWQEIHHDAEGFYTL